MSAAATATKLGGPIQSSSPTKHASRPPPPTTTSDTHTPPVATAKGSRRAQGWHSAVGGTAGTTGTTTTATAIASSGGSTNGIRETHSNLEAKALTHSRVSSGMPRRPSVQFSEDAVDNHSSPRAASKPRTTAPTNTNANPKQDDAAFRQSMADFLTVMYGDRTAAPTSKSGGQEKKGQSGIQPLPRSGSPHLPPSGVKGPLVKGLTATGSRHAPSGDRIDTLVDTLVRAYSRQTTSSRGDFHGSSGGPDDENPISYNRPRHQNYRRAVASPRLGRGSRANSGADTNEVSLFVSQAMDSFIGPGGLRQQGLPSTRSVLSSLGVDKNIFGLMAFQTHSNMQDIDAVEEEGSETKLEPMYVGEQALFRSVGTRPNMNDVSISKSLRGVIPAPAKLDEAFNSSTNGSEGRGEAQRRISNGSASRQLTNDSGRSRNNNDNNNSNYSLDSAVVAGKRDSGSQSGGSSGTNTAPRFATRKLNNDKSITRCMSLDSKALGAAAGAGNGGEEEDDSWGDDNDAPLPVSRAGAAGPPSSQPIVSSARSLLDYSKSRHSAALEKALGELYEEEQLKRDVVAAVERQLRGYIVSLESEERSKRRGQRGGGGTAGSSGRATTGASPAGLHSAVNGPAAASKDAVGQRSARGGSGGPNVNSTASPPMKNMVDFFEKGTSPTPQPEPVKRLSR